MSNNGVMDRFLALTKEEKAKYLPKKKYEMLSDVQEGGLLIKNVPHVSYVAPDLDKSFVPPDVRRVIIDYMRFTSADIRKTKGKKKSVIEYSDVKDKVYAIH